MTEDATARLTRILNARAFQGEHAAHDWIIEGAGTFVTAAELRAILYDASRLRSAARKTEWRVTFNAPRSTEGADEPWFDGDEVIHTWGERPVQHCAFFENPIKATFACAEAEERGGVDIELHRSDVTSVTTAWQRIEPWRDVMEDLEAKLREEGSL